MSVRDRKKYARLLHKLFAFVEMDEKKGSKFLKSADKKCLHAVCECLLNAVFSNEILSEDQKKYLSQEFTNSQNDLGKIVFRKMTDCGRKKLCVRNQEVIKCILKWCIPFLTYATSNV